MKQTKARLTETQLVAPCGINCRVCRAYGRENRPCPGCRGEDELKCKTCVNCRIKNCEKLVRDRRAYCFGCDAFPCERLSHLDKRYRARYGTSVVENLRSIKKAGIRKFVENENERWTCPECGSLLCMHDPTCHSCGYAWLDNLPPRPR